MKKLVSLISALTMCAVMAAPIASSAATITPESDSKGTEVTVGCTTETLYTIIIPDNTSVVDISEGSTLTFEASDVRLPDGKSIMVTAEGSKKLKYTGKDGEVKDEIDYTISSDDVVLVTAGDKSKGGTKEFKVEVTEDAKQAALYAGEYTDKITFTVAVEDTPSVDDNSSENEDDEKSETPETPLESNEEQE